MPSPFEPARLVATCLSRSSGSDSPAPPHDIDIDDLAGQMLGFAPRAVVRVVDAARKAARRKPRASVLESDFDLVLDAVPSLDTLAPNREASDGLVCDWVDELAVARDHAGGRARAAGGRRRRVGGDSVKPR